MNGHQDEFAALRLIRYPPRNTGSLAALARASRMCYTGSWQRLLETPSPQETSFMLIEGVHGGILKATTSVR